MRLLGPTLGLFVLAAGLTAQTMPVPRLPPEPTPEPEPTPLPQTPQKGPPAPAQQAEDPALTRPRPWEYAMGLGVRWDSNIDFRIPDGPSGSAVVPRGSLARIFWSPRGQLRAEAAGRWIGYADQQEPGRGYADFSLAGGYRSSPNSSWRANASYALGHSDSSQPLQDQGVLLPLVKTRTFTGALGMSRQVGTRTSLRIDGRIYRIEFDAPGVFTGESSRGTVGLEHRLSSRSSAAIVYSLEDVRADQQGRSYLTHFGSLQLTRVLSPRSAILLEGGASYTPDAARAGLPGKQSFFGGASVTRQVKRSGLTVFLRREVAPAFGTGLSRLEVRAGLSAAIPMGRQWRLRMASTHVRPDSPPVGAQTYPSGDDASVTLGRRLGGRLELSGEALYRRRGATNSLPSIEAFQAGLFLTLLSSSGRAREPATGR